MIGAVLIGAGWQAINLDEFKKILIALFTSPFIGFIFGFILLRIIMMPVLERIAESQCCLQARPDLYRSGPGAQPWHQ